MGACGSHLSAIEEAVMLCVTTTPSHTVTPGQGRSTGERFPGPVIDWLILVPWYLRGFEAPMEYRKSPATHVRLCRLCGVGTPGVTPMKVELCQTPISGSERRSLSTAGSEVRQKHHHSGDGCCVAATRLPLWEGERSWRGPREGGSDWPANRALKRPASRPNSRHPDSTPIVSRS